MQCQCRLDKRGFMGTRFQILKGYQPRAHFSPSHPFVFAPKRGQKDRINVPRRSQRLTGAH